jgi:hypothetical protein
VIDPDLQGLGDENRAGCREPINALLVFLYLLPADADRGGQLAERKAGRLPGGTN